MKQDLIKIYGSLKRILKKFENPLISKSDLESKYDLWSIKNIELEGRKKKGVFFAGLIIQSSYVGFYFMPVYTDENLKSVFHPDLLKLLKGKSCFHIKKLESDLENHIEDALQRGYELYKRRGWI